MGNLLSPVREIKNVLDDSGDSRYINRLLVGTPATGLVRIEWVAARYSQIIPMNWSQVQVNEYMSSYIPTRWEVGHAQNLIVDQFVRNDFEWLFLLEHDVVLPDNTLMALNEYMRDAKYPIVSGLYYSRSRPSEPLVFRGRGNSVYMDWKMGDKVWVDGLPTGCLLIHSSILKLMWNESPEYVTPKGRVTRRVFETPRNLLVDMDQGIHNAVSGTSDLFWCDRVMKEKVIERAGWDMSYCPESRYRFLIDTSLFCRHINNDGEQFP